MLLHTLQMVHRTGKTLVQRYVQSSEKASLLPMLLLIYNISALIITIFMEVYSFLKEKGP